ncbi:MULTISPECIES: hypothetical protein [unclassified Streptomyces]|uniref:hypothetical protein n=1 Tax=unclassified Streptomyces TaxID=2593676 RepID=UPI001644BDA0|nr:hypothetical protein [Streptomyces sp. BK340]
MTSVTAVVAVISVISVVTVAVTVAVVAVVVTVAVPRRAVARRVAAMVVTLCRHETAEDGHMRSS